MTFSLKALAALVALVVLALALAGYQARGKSAAEARAVVADSAAEAWHVRFDGKAAVFLHDTTVVLRAVRHTDTVLTHLIDTAIVHRVDSVTVAVPVLVAARDTLRACAAVIVTCGEALAAARGEIGALTTARDAWKRAAKVGTLWGLPLPVVMAGYGVTYDVTTGRVANGPTLSVGWRLSF